MKLQYRKLLIWKLEVLKPKTPVRLCELSCRNCELIIQILVDMKTQIAKP